MRTRIQRQREKSEREEHRLQLDYEQSVLSKRNEYSKQFLELQWITEKTLQDVQFLAEEMDYLETHCALAEESLAAMPHEEEAERDGPRRTFSGGMARPAGMCGVQGSGSLLSSTYTY